MNFGIGVLNYFKIACIKYILYRSPYKIVEWHQTQHRGNDSHHNFCWNCTQNFDCGIRCMARSTILLKSNFVHVFSFNFHKEPISKHWSLALTINGYSDSFFIFEEKFPDDATSPTRAPSSDSLWKNWLFYDDMQFLRVPGGTILLANTTTKMKMCFVWIHEFSEKLIILCETIFTWTWQLQTIQMVNML